MGIYGRNIRPGQVQKMAPSRFSLSKLRQMAIYCAKYVDFTTSLPQKISCRYLKTKRDGPQKLVLSSIVGLSGWCWLWHKMASSYWVLIGIHVSILGYRHSITLFSVLYHFLTVSPPVKGRAHIKLCHVWYRWIRKT